MGTIAVGAGAMIALLGSSVVLGSTEPPADETGGPRIEVVGGPEVDNLTFEVEGTGWPGNSIVQLEFCGNRALNGSVDCVSSTAQTVAANFQGWFLGRVSTTAPPTPCPCVVRALGESGTLVATTPVRVEGVPEVLLDDAVVEPRSIRRIGVVRARLEGGGSLTSWLGGAPERRLILKVVNSGNVPVDTAVVTMSIGSGSNPTGFVPPVAIEPLDVGATTTIEVDLEFDALSFGEQAVVGEIGGTSEPTTFRVTTTSYPWLLIVFAAILFQLAILRVRNAIRRRAFPELPALPAPPTVPELPAGVAGIDDAVYLISMVKDVEARTVMAIQVVLGQTSFIVPGDRTCGPTMFAVRGKEAVEELLTVVVEDARSEGNDALVTEMIDLVHVASIGGTTVEESRATAAGLARWIGDDLGVDVRIDDRAETGPSWPPPGCLRVASGPPPLMFRIELDDDVDRSDALAAADHVSNAHITAQLLDDDETPFLCVHVTDWTSCRLDVLYEQVASRVEVTAAAPVGLVPLGVLERIDPERWAQLGLELAGTYESRIAAGAPTEVSEALG